VRLHQEPPRTLTRGQSFAVATLLKNDVEQSVLKRPIFWLLIVVYSILWPAVLALSFSFVYGSGDIPDNPVEFFQDELGNDCGYLFDGCFFNGTQAPTPPPTPFPTTSPTEA